MPHGSQVARMSEFLTEKSLTGVSGAVSNRKYRLSAVNAAIDEHLTNHIPPHFLSNRQFPCWLSREPL
jgi:hypothetical protein